MVYGTLLTRTTDIAILNSALGDIVPLELTEKSIKLEKTVHSAADQAWI